MRRHDVEQEIGEQELGAADAALDGARQAAGLALEMEAQRQRMEMAEGRERHLPHRVLLRPARTPRRAARPKSCAPTRATP